VCGARGIRGARLSRNASAEAIERSILRVASAVVMSHDNMYRSRVRRLVATSSRWGAGTSKNTCTKLWMRGVRTGPHRARTSSTFMIELPYDSDATRAHACHVRLQRW
jgi:hypothetical protein